MWCSKCGVELPEGALFCGSCGAKVRKQDEVETQTTAVVEELAYAAGISTDDTSTTETIETVDTSRACETNGKQQPSADSSAGPKLPSSNGQRIAVACSVLVVVFVAIVVSLSLVTPTGASSSSSSSSKTSSSASSSTSSGSSSSNKSSSSSGSSSSSSSGSSSSSSSGSKSSSSSSGSSGSSSSSSSSSKSGESTTVTWLDGAPGLEISSNKIKSLGGDKYEFSATIKNTSTKYTYDDIEIKWITFSGVMPVGMSTNNTKVGKRLGPSSSTTVTRQFRSEEDIDKARAEFVSAKKISN